MFSWVPFYQELSRCLLDFKLRQGELIAMLEELREQGLKVSPLADRNAQGSPFLLTEIDPFTVLATFNRGLTIDNRIAILAAFKQRLGLESALPTDFAGVPVVVPLRAWFIAYSTRRDPSDVSRLWRIFEIAVSSD